MMRSFEIFDRHPFHFLIKLSIFIWYSVNTCTRQQLEQLLEAMSQKWMFQKQDFINILDRYFSFTTFSFVVRKSKTFTGTFCLCQASCSFTKKNRCYDCSLVIIFRVNLGIKSDLFLLLSSGRLKVTLWVICWTPRDEYQVHFYIYKPSVPLCVSSCLFETKKTFFGPFAPQYTTNKLDFSQASQFSCPFMCQSLKCCIKG